MTPLSSSKYSAQVRPAATGSLKAANTTPRPRSAATSCSTRTASVRPSTSARTTHGRLSCSSLTLFFALPEIGIELPLAELFTGRRLRRAQSVPSAAGSPNPPELPPLVARGALDPGKSRGRRPPRATIEPSVRRNLRPVARFPACVRRRIGTNSPSRRDQPGTGWRRQVGSLSIPGGETMPAAAVQSPKVVNKILWAVVVVLGAVSFAVVALDARRAGQRRLARHRRAVQLPHRLPFLRAVGGAPGLRPRSRA